MSSTALALFAGPPPDLARAPREGVLDAQAVRAALGRSKREALLGLALLWHDHWDAAHEIAQAREGTPDFDLVHALAHRREPDYSNSAYWFSSAGKHACYPLIAARVAAAFPEESQEFLVGGNWSPSAFIAAIRKAGKSSGTAAKTASLLRRIQAEEFRAIAEFLSAES